MHTTYTWCGLVVVCPTLAGTVNQLLLGTADQSIGCCRTCRKGVVPSIMQPMQCVNRLIDIHHIVLLCVVVVELQSPNAKRNLPPGMFWADAGHSGPATTILELPGVGSLSSASAASLRSSASVFSNQSSQLSGELSL